MLPAQQRAQEIRAKLYNPPNAVEDIGIDLKRKIIPIESVESPKVVIPITDDPPTPPVKDELAELETQIAALNAQLDKLNDRYFVLANIRRPSVREIQEAVCAHFGVPFIDLISSRRDHPIVKPRQIAMYLAKTLTLRSLPEVGRQFGGRDHTTVLHAVRKIENLAENDPRFKRETIEKLIGEISTKTGIVLNV